MILNVFTRKVLVTTSQLQQFEQNCQSKTSPPTNFLNKIMDMQSHTRPAENPAKRKNSSEGNVMINIFNLCLLKNFIVR